RVGFRIVFPGAAEGAAVLVALAERELQHDAIIGCDVWPLQLLFHRLDIFVTEGLGLHVGNAPIGNPERWTDRDGSPISSDAVFLDRKSTRLNSSHLGISYAVFCLKKKNKE